MRQVRVAESVELAAPIADAYTFVTDLRNDPQWWSGVRDVRPVDGQRDAADQAVTLLGIRLTIRVELREAEPPRHAVLVCPSPTLPFTATYRFEALDDRRTRFSMDATVGVAGPFRVLGPVFGVLLRRITRHHLQRLAALFASTPPVAPGRWPVVGHLPALIRDPLGFVASLPAVGPLVTIQLGRTPTYVVNDPELIRRVLVSDVDAFEKGAEYAELRHLLGNGFSLAEGADHRARRRLLQPLFVNERVAGHREMMREVALDVTAGWSSGDVIDVNDTMRSLSATVVARAVCSTDLNPAHLATISRELPIVMDGVRLRSLAPGNSKRLLVRTNRRFFAANAQLRAVVRSIVEDRQAGSGEDDLLAMLLAAHDPVTDAARTADVICDDVINLFFAATETTGNALTWVWHALATHPEVERRLHEELAQGDLEYLQQVLRETLRVFPPPWLMMRRATRSIRLGEHHVEAGSAVWYSPFAVQRSPHNFVGGDQFDPDRWCAPRTPEHSPHAFLTFGAGPHVCLGRTFALLEMTTAVAAIASRWRLRPVASNASPKASATLVLSDPRMHVELHETPTHHPSPTAAPNVRGCGLT